MGSRTKLFLAMFFGFVQSIYAGETKVEINQYDLGKIVVTPTRKEQAVKDLSLSVSVITKEEIEASTANTATDILNILPGVFVHKTGPFGRADVEIRGHGSRGRRIMVLVDGKPEKMGLFGCTITHSLPLDNVERIEVVRGPASVLYGSDALGGVINIITRKPKERFEGDTTVSYGSYDAQVYRLRQGGNLERFNYYFTVDERRSRGHLPNSDYDHTNFTLRLGSNLNDNLEAIFTSRYFDGFKREPRLWAAALADNWNNYERGAFDLTLNGKWEIVDGMLKVYRNFGEHIFEDGWHSKDYTNGVMLHANFNLFDRNTLSLGMEFREQGGKVLGGPGVRKGKYDKDEIAFFIHDEQRFFDDKLIVSGGLRYNDDELAGDIVCPQAGLVYHLTEKTKLRTAVNRGFRAPQLNELRFLRWANPDLKPEKAWNYETGFSQEINENLNFDFTYFIMRAKDFIRISAGKFRNIDKVEFKGIETSLEYRILKELFGRLSYTYLDSGKYTKGRPENEIDLSLIYRKEKYSLNLSGQYVDNYFAEDNKRKAIPNFFVVNTKLTYNFNPNFEIFLGIDNLFNVEHKIYADLPGAEGGVYTQPKRTLSLGLKFEW